MPKRVTLALLAVLAMAFGLRVWGIKWGIPKEPYWDNHHPDEKVGMTIVYTLATERGLNPHYFVNPSWHYYTLAFVNWLAGASGIVPTLDQVASGEAELGDVTNIWLVARMVSVVLGAASVLLVFLAAARLFGNLDAGLLSAWLAAVNPVLVAQSHYITVDGPAVFWLLLAFCLLLLSLDKPGIRYAVLAGAAGGLAAATKYTGLLIVLPAAMAYAFGAGLAPRGRAAGPRMIAPYAIGLLAGFLAGCPCALLSFGEFRQGLQLMSQYNQFATDLPHPWLVTSRLALGWPLWAAFLLSLAAAFYRPNTRMMMLAVPAAGLFLMLGFSASPYFRHLLPAVPLALMLTAGMAVKLLGWRPARWRTALAAAVLAWTCWGAVYATANSLAWVRIMAAQDTREEATDYLNSHYPPGSEIAVAGIYEFYSPNLDRFEKIRLQYDLEQIRGHQSGPIVVSDYEREGLSFSRRTAGQAAVFFGYLEGNYRPRAVFRRVPACCGLKFTGYPMADWRYFYPEITIYERRQ
jgi:hypothetical protein